MLRTIVSILMMSSLRQSISRSERVPRKCVGTRARPSRSNSAADIRLLTTPLPTIVPRLSALNAVASSLKYWMTVPGRLVAYTILALPS